MTGFLTAILTILGLAFWVWSAPEAIDTSPVGTLNALNPFLALVIEMLIMTGVFVFLTVTVVNLRMYITQIRSGWGEIILLLIVVFTMTFLMFEAGVTMVTLLLSLAFVVYLYLLQEE
jgi:hypothetical protein